MLEVVAGEEKLALVVKVGVVVMVVVVGESSWLITSSTSVVEVVVVVDVYLEHVVVTAWQMVVCRTGNTCRCCGES